MPIETAGQGILKRAGLAFIYRAPPMLVATVFFGIYLTCLYLTTLALAERGFSTRANIAILILLYAIFAFTASTWFIEVQQLIALSKFILSPVLADDEEKKFQAFYEYVSKKVQVTGILFQCQIILGDAIVLWRALAIWYDRRAMVLIPGVFWGLLIVNMFIRAFGCGSGIPVNAAYSRLCKATDVLGPVLSILTNILVVVLVLGKAWSVRGTLKRMMGAGNSNKILTIFILLVESGTIYVVILATHLTVTSIAIGGPETVKRMISCLVGWTTVQILGIYPTVMILIIRRSVWNASNTTIGSATVANTNAISTAMPEFCTLSGEETRSTTSSVEALSPIARPGPSLGAKGLREEDDPEKGDRREFRL